MADRTPSTPTSSGGCESAFLPPEAERFLRRPVGVAEDYAVGHRREASGLQGRNDENVVRGELEMHPSDVDAAPPFDDAVDCAVGTTAVPACESFRQLLHERSQGRERILAGVAIRIAQLPAVAPVGLAPFRQFFEQPA